jgi:hypothetical protein
MWTRWGVWKFGVSTMWRVLGTFTNFTFKLLVVNIMCHWKLRNKIRLGLRPQVSTGAKYYIAKISQQNGFSAEKCGWVNNQVAQKSRRINNVTARKLGWLRTLDYPLVGLMRSSDKILEISWTWPKVFSTRSQKKHFSILINHGNILSAL